MQLLSAAVACDVCDSSTVPWKLCVLVCIAFAMPTRSVLYLSTRVAARRRRCSHSSHDACASKVPVHTGPVCKRRSRKGINPRQIP